MTIARATHLRETDCVAGHVRLPSRFGRRSAGSLTESGRCLPSRRISFGGRPRPEQFFASNRARCPHCGKASRRDYWNESSRPRVQSSGAVMPRTAISGLVCTTFLVLLGFPAVPQEPAGKGADTESGQLTFNNACRTCHTTKEGDN